MGLLALLLAGLAGWLIWTGRLQRMTAKDGMALGAALVGAVMAAKGKPIIGAPLLVGAALYFAQQGKARTSGAKKPAPVAPPGSGPGSGPKSGPPPASPDAIVQARHLLGLSPDADAAAIRAAHRRLIASVHPDRGGTEALAAQINAARDLLLEQGASRTP